MSWLRELLISVQTCTLLGSELYLCTTMYTIVCLAISTMFSIVHKWVPILGLPRGASGPLEGAEFLGRVAGQTSKHANMPLLLALLLYGGLSCICLGSLLSWVSLGSDMGPNFQIGPRSFNFLIFWLPYLSLVIWILYFAFEIWVAKRRTVNNSNRRV